MARTLCSIDRGKGDTGMKPLSDLSRRQWRQTLRTRTHHWLDKVARALL